MRGERSMRAAASLAALATLLALSSPQLSSAELTSTAAFIPAFGLLGIAWAGCDSLAVVLLLCISSAFGGASYAAEYEVGTPVPNTLCSFMIEASKRKTGFLLSPTYPGIYPKDMTCNYLFSGQPGQRIRLEFRDFDLFFGGPQNNCLLFSNGEWQPDDGQLSVNWAPCAYCNYVLFVGVIMFIVCCVQIYRLSMFMYSGVDSSFLSAFLEAMVCVVLCCLTVSAAVIVTLGFMTWCETIVQRFPSCEDAAGEPINSKDLINTSGFYIEIGSAQFGAWTAFATWVGLAVFSTLKVCRYHQLENIQVSMYRERQRLVNESGSPTAQEGRSTPPLDVDPQGSYMK